MKGKKPTEKKERKQNYWKNERKHWWKKGKFYNTVKKTSEQKENRVKKE